MRKVPPQFVDIGAWVDSGRTDPVRHRLRQAAHILLNAIAGIHPSYTLYLKGGLLLGLIYNSPRFTTDIDFTAGFAPRQGADQKLKTDLNNILPAMVAQLGYTGTRAEVTRSKTLPERFSDCVEKAAAPAFRFTVRYDSKGQHTDYFKIDISFREPELRQIEIFDIGGGAELRAYGLTEVIAEKYRALLQQEERRRQRRQDVFDLDFLQRKFSFDATFKADLLESLVEKCRARGIKPNIRSFDNPEIGERASADWDSIKLETGELPEFESCFENVRRLYRDLPWDHPQSALRG